MKNPVVAAALLFVLLSGCATKAPAPKSRYVPVGATLGETLQSRGIRLLATPAPSFVRITRGDQVKLTTGMMFGAIGGGIGAAIVLSQAEDAGRAIATENGITDPTLRLAERVRDMLATRYGSATTDSGLAVTVSTDNWSLTMDDLVFRASVVIDDTNGKAAKPKKPLAKGTCGYRSASNGATADDLLANGAERLKRELDAALEHCAQEFNRKLFP